MLEKIIILAIVFVVSSTMIYFVRNAKPKEDQVDPLNRIYRLHFVFRWLPVAALAIIGSILVYDITFDVGASEDFKNGLYSKEVFEWIGIFMAIVIVWFYLGHLKVYFDGNNLVRKTMFGTKKIPIDRIYKIVEHPSSGNPIAAMTKVYARTGGKRRRIKVEALIDGYDTLIAEISYRAPQAKYIEK